MSKTKSRIGFSHKVARRWYGPGREETQLLDCKVQALAALRLIGNGEIRRARSRLSMIDHEEGLNELEQIAKEGKDKKQRILAVRALGHCCNLRKGKLASRKIKKIALSSEDSEIQEQCCESLFLAYENTAIKGRRIEILIAIKSIGEKTQIQGIGQGIVIFLFGKYMRKPDKEIIHSIVAISAKTDNPLIGVLGIIVLREIYDAYPVSRNKILGELRYCIDTTILDEVKDAIEQDFDLIRAD